MCSPPCARRRPAPLPADPARSGPAPPAARAATGATEAVCPAPASVTQPGIRPGLPRPIRRPRAAGHAANGFETPDTARRRLEPAAAGPLVSEAG